MAFSDSDLEAYLKEKEDELMKSYVRAKIGAPAQFIGQLVSSSEDNVRRLASETGAAAYDALEGISRIPQAFGNIYLEGLGNEAKVGQSSVGIRPEEANAFVEQSKKGLAETALMRGLEASAKSNRELAEFTRSPSAYAIDRSRDSALTAQLAGGLGSLPVAIASGPAAPAVVAGMMGAQGARDARESLDRRGITDPAEIQRAEDEALLANAALGLVSEPLLGAPAMLKSVRGAGAGLLAKAGVRPATTTTGRAAQSLVKGTLREAAQEGLVEQLGANVVAKDLVGYDPERARSEGVLESAVLGGLIGGPTSAAFQIAQDRDSADANKALAARLDTAKNIPESVKTLLLQQDQLRRGLRPAQMFPKGTEELGLPEQMERIETDRGIFHYNPAQVSRQQILAASARGEENLILGLGPVSKPAAEARAAATGEPLVVTTERAADGTEIKSAVGTTGTAAAQAAALEANKSPGSTISTTTPGQTIVERLQAKQAAQAAAAKAALEKETAERTERQAVMDAKKQRIEETMVVAREWATDPEIDLPRLKAAVTSLDSGINDIGIGLTLEQRNQAAALRKRLTPRYDELLKAEDAAFEKRRVESQAKLKAEEAKLKAARKAEVEAINAIKTTGRDPREGNVIVELANVPDDEFYGLENNLDAEGLDINTWQEELDRRMKEAERTDDSAMPNITLADVFTGANGAKKWLGKTLRIKPAGTLREEGDPLAGDMALVQENLPIGWLDRNGMTLEGAVEALRGYGFNFEVPADLLEALRSPENVRPSQAGQDVNFAEREDGPLPYTIMRSDLVESLVLNDMERSEAQQWVREFTAMPGVDAFTALSLQPMTPVNTQRFMRFWRERNPNASETIGPAAEPAPSRSLSPRELAETRLRNGLRNEYSTPEIDDIIQEISAAESESQALENIPTSFEKVAIAFWEAAQMERPAPTARYGFGIRPTNSGNLWLAEIYSDGSNRLIDVVGKVEQPVAAYNRAVSLMQQTRRPLGLLEPKGYVPPASPTARSTEAIEATPEEEALIENRLRGEGRPAARYDYSIKRLDSGESGEGWYLFEGAGQVTYLGDTSNGTDSLRTDAINAIFEAEADSEAYADLPSEEVRRRIGKRLAPLPSSNSSPAPTATREQAVRELIAFSGLSRPAVEDGLNQLGTYAGNGFFTLIYRRLREAQAATPPADPAMLNRIGSYIGYRVPNTAQAPAPAQRAPASAPSPELARELARELNESPEWAMRRLEELEDLTRNEASAWSSSLILRGARPQIVDAVEAYIDQVHPWPSRTPAATLPAVSYQQALQDLIGISGLSRQSAANELDEILGHAKSGEYLLADRRLRRVQAGTGPEGPAQLGRLRRYFGMPDTAPAPAPAPAPTPAPAQPAPAEIPRSALVRVGSFFKKVAAQASAWQLGPTPTSKDVADIAKAYSTKKVRILSEPMGNGYKLQTFDEAGNRIGYITFYEEFDSGIIFVAATEAKSNKGSDRGGKQMYQTIFTWAHNNGKIVEGSSLSPINQVRRTVNMLSSALRHNTTKHLKPYDAQDISRWIVGDTENNIGAMVLALSRKLSVLTNRRLDALTYDVKTDSVVDNVTGLPLSPAELGRIVDTDKLFEKGFGIATVRAILAGRAQLAAYARGQRLDAKASRQAAVSGSLRGVLYAERALRGGPPARRGADAASQAEPTRDLPVAPAPTATSWRDIPRLRTDAEVDAEIEGIRAILPRLAKILDLEVGDISELLSQARRRRITAPASVEAAVTTDIKTGRPLVAVTARAAQEGSLSALFLHEIGHKYWDVLPDYAKDFLRQLHERETSTRTGPLFNEDRSKRTKIKILKEEFSAERLAQDQDLAVKEWFCERIAAMNRDWLAGRMPKGAPLLTRLWRQFLDFMSATFAGVRKLDPDSEVFKRAFRQWLKAGDIGTADTATAYARGNRGRAQFATTQSTMDLGGMALGLDLPDTIRNLTPKYQDKTVRFESNLDKALYYAGGEGQTATKTAITEHLQRETGLTPGQIAHLARELRRKLGPIARSTARDGTMRVPAQMQAEARKLTGVDFAASTPTANTSTGGSPTASQIIALARELDAPGFRAKVQKAKEFIAREAAKGIPLSPAMQADQVTLAALSVLQHNSADPRAMAILRWKDDPRTQFAEREEEFAKAFDQAAEDFYQSMRDSVSTDPQRVSAEDKAARNGEILTLDQAADRVAEWKALAAKEGTTGKNQGKTILSLFDSTGVWSRPWREAGFNVIQIDQKIVGGDGYEMDVMDVDQDWLMDNGLDMVHGVLAACPCTEFAGSGARWFAIKDANGRTKKAAQLVNHTLAVIEYLQPEGFWAIENPIGRIKQETEIPTERLQFQPHNYGDPYTKRTQIFGSFNANLPQANVEPTGGSFAWNLTGNRDESKAARSKTFEGFAYAFFAANYNRDGIAEAEASTRREIEQDRAYRERGRPEEITGEQDDIQFAEREDAPQAPQLPALPPGANTQKGPLGEARHIASRWRNIMPGFQGNKVEMATYAASVIRSRMTAEARAAVQTVEDWFGGGGSWGLHLALSHFPNANRLHVHEFLPDRLEKIRLFHTEGGAIKADIDKLAPQVADAIEKMKVDGKPSPAAFVSRLKAIIGESTDPRTRALLTAIEDRADNDFATSKDEEGNRSAIASVADLLAKVVADAAAAKRGADAFRQRGGQIEYTSGDSYGAPYENSDSTFSVFDPPYYKTAGYSAADSEGGKVPLSIYRRTADRINELARAGHGILYTDSAWWIDERLRAERAAAEEKAPKKTNGKKKKKLKKGSETTPLVIDEISIKPDPEGHAQLRYILDSLDYANTVPIAKRNEILGFNSLGSSRKAHAAQKPRRAGGNGGIDAGGMGNQRPGAGTTRRADMGATEPAPSDDVLGLQDGSPAGADSDVVVAGDNRAGRAAALKAALPPGVTTGSALSAEQEAEAQHLSEAAKATRHPAAVGDVEPTAAWASVAKLTEPQLAEQIRNIETYLSDNFLDLADASKAHLQAVRAATKMELDRRQAETAAKSKPAAPAAPAMPKPDRKAALVAQWKQGKLLRAQANLNGNQIAEDEAQHQVSSAKRALDDEYPEWEAEQVTPPQGRPQNPRTERAAAAPAPAPVPGRARADQVTQDDGRNLPTPPPPEPPEKGAPAADEPAPDRNRAHDAFGHTAATPFWWERSWSKAREVLVGFRGAVPELQAFPDTTDRFVREYGKTFYNGLKAFYRTLASANDFVQRTAEEQVAGVTEPLMRLGGRFDADAYKQIQRRQEQARRAAAEGRPMPAGAKAELEALNLRLQSHPYYLFNRLVYFMDLDWRYRNLKDSEGNPIKQPLGLNETEIRNELKALGDAIAASPHAAAIEAAYEKHVALVKQISEDLKGRDLFAAEALANPVYFPHITLEVRQGDKVVQRELRPERVRVGVEADFRGYLQDPIGSAKPIESDYVRAMYYHLVQVGAHNLKADAVRDHVRPYNIMTEVEATAKQMSRQRPYTVSWEQAFHEVYEPRGYVLYGTDSRDAFPSVNVDREKLARRLGVVLTGEDLQKQLAAMGLKGIQLLPEDLKETLMQGQREMWVVPARVAEALRGIADRQTQRDDPISAALKTANGWWKAWKLFMPQNHIRYEYGNVVADLEKIISSSPRTFRKLPQAAKEMRAFFNGEVPSEDLRAALKDGVINAITAQEMQQLQRLRAFEKFQTKTERALLQTRKRASSLLYQPLTNLIGLGDLSSVELSAFREGVTRYANYLSNLDAIRNGARPDYAGAYHRDIEALQESSPGAGDRAQRQASQISKATFGDYGDLSVTGQWLRDHMIPFYSWMEINFKYHANLFRNNLDLVRGQGTTGKGLTATAAQGSALAGAFVARLAIPYVMLALYNATMSGVDDDELSEEDRRRIHLRLGHTEDGKPIVIYGATALADVMKWVSGAKMAQAGMSWIAGKTDFATAFNTWASEIPGDFANNTLGSTGPLVKIGTALTLKKSTFPDVLDAKTIPDYDLRRNIIGQMTDDFTADQLERVVNKDYAAPKDYGVWAKQVILQMRQRDPESWAFYSIKDKAAAFVETRTGQSRDSSYNAPDQQVLRNFRRAIYQGDPEQAARFYLRLLELGYTSERFASSIRAQDPLSALPKENGLRRQFVESLRPDEQAQLKRAYAYYTRLSAERGAEGGLFPSKRFGERGQQAFEARPRLDLLNQTMQRRDQMTEREVLRQAAVELQKSLAGPN